MDTGWDDDDVFLDAVNGHSFSLKPYCRPIIDTPVFQRLRGLIQLGSIRFVYPCAVHTRFEHSLGTAYKAHKVCQGILKQQPELALDAHDVKLVTLAGLCHDLGHGPLSHPFTEVIERLGVRDWRHEEMSGRLLQYLVDSGQVDMERSDVRAITELILGRPEQMQPQGGGGELWRPGRRFLFDIVANKRNSVDVDKVDYLQRDSAMTGVRVGCDFGRLTKKKFIKVLDDEVCYHWSEYGNILDLFRARETLHRKVYMDRRCKAVELMLVDALVAAGPLLRIQERLQSPEDFISLDDSLLTTIEHYQKNHRGSLDDVETASLAAAQSLLRRLRTRQLYRFGNQVTVPPEYLADRRWESISKRFTPSEVASCYSGSELPGGLKPADVICDENKIDHTMGGANPVERVGFFKRYDTPCKFHITNTQVVGIMPHTFQERVLRVFTPHSDERYVVAIEQALRGWVARHLGGSVRMATPLQPRKQDGPGEKQRRNGGLRMEVLRNHAINSIRQGATLTRTGSGGMVAASSAVEFTPPRVNGRSGAPLWPGEESDEGEVERVEAEAGRCGLGGAQEEGGGPVKRQRVETCG